MDQVYNSMLYMAQPAAERPAAKPAQPQQKESFQKQMEQAAGQTEGTEARTEISVQEQTREGQPAVDSQELEERMALAAMTMVQHPVVPLEQAATPEEAPLEAVAAVGAADVESLVPAVEAEAAEVVPEAADTAEIVPAEGAEETVRQIPQEQVKPAAAETETTEITGMKAEVKVTAAEAGEARPEADTQDTPQEGMAETPVFREVREIPVKVGEPAAAEETREIPVEDQVAPRLAEALKSGETRVEIQLEPENLGKVTVEVTLREDGTLHVALHAENSQTRGLLERSADSLMAMLGREARQEVQVEVPRQQESQQQNFYDGRQGHEHQGRQQQERRQEQRGGSEDFLHQLRLGLVPGDGE